MLSGRKQKDLAGYFSQENVPAERRKQLPSCKMVRRHSCLMGVFGNTIVADFVRERDEAEFISWMLKQGTGKETISSRRSGLRHFARWYYLTKGKVLAPADITDDDLNAYEQHLWGSRRPIHKRKLLAGGTISSYLSSVKAFLKWANEPTLSK